MITYDPRGHTWDSWCALMAELFAQQQLGTAPEEKWKEWASGMQGVGYFVNSGVPDPQTYTNWRTWAENVCGIMSING